MATIERFLTPAEDAEFDGYVADWARQLGLDDWDFYRGAGKPKNAMADITPNVAARYGKIRTGNWTHIDPTPAALARIALHEVLHVFLAELIAAAESDSHDWLASVEHRVVNVLVKRLTTEDTE